MTLILMGAAVFARGFVVGESPANIDGARLDHWNEAGKLVVDFNAYIAADPRITVTIWPFFDGISEIKLKH